MTDNNEILNEEDGLIEVDKTRRLADEIAGMDPLLIAVADTVLPMATLSLATDVGQLVLDLGISDHPNAPHFADLALGYHLVITAFESMVKEDDA